MHPSLVNIGLKEYLCHMRKKCVFCGSKAVIKKGLENGVQQWRCKDCQRNMPWLWTFYDRPELGLPNTNNEMEALFSSVKDKLRLHSGLSAERRKVLIEELFFAHSPRR